ncbi:PTS sugar transporter subunit IIA [Brevibacillus sp. SYP-B805]|uniref:PTS sugar transporter subunit IIA n=1 Tax=Brevibacillus sp. SYP-B805 TaxID=1578199 RepID=UPI0013EABB79|nr:PTS sugar transporter subunit IIA [Brevibacillus sp. SYP-B805]NGQ95760.1 PTS sugar transporter subunit IIA [Brevibacillus sp. SYP-B805]
MVGIVITAHGPLPSALIETAEMIVGKQESLMGVSLMPGESPEELYAKVKVAIQSVNRGSGVLLLTDLIGGSPCNTIASILAEGIDCQAVTGVNIPMLLDVLLTRGTGDIHSLAETAVQSGGTGILNVGAFLKED